MLPESFSVAWLQRTEVFDGMSTVEGWSEPVDLAVYGWAPPSPDDILRPEQTGVEHVLDVYMRDSPTGHRDKLIVNGTEFTVQGSPDDYRFGPFGFKPGVRVRVSRVVG